jgi:hypothetical protein
MKQTHQLYTRSFLFGILLVCCLPSCKRMDGYNDPISADATKPGTVTNVKVDNFSGGAHITYTLPNSPNLLYILAEYRINDKTTRQTKSSYYSDTITVSGFEKNREYEVTLWAVSRANVRSDAVKVTVHPTDPYYRLVLPTVTMAADFSGINVKAVNTLKKPVGIILVTYDKSTLQYEIQDQHYTSVDSIDYSVRGFDTTNRKFGIYVTDQYGNISDTLYQNISPLFEAKIDKGKFFNYRLNSDGKIEYGWDVPYLWDNKTDGYSSGWHTDPGGKIPMICTFGIGVKAKLSRFMIWERPDEWCYAHGNPKAFSLWGSDKASPADAALPRYSEPGTVVGDWVNMGNYRYPDPPSGQPITSLTAEDRAFVAAGVNFNVPFNSPEIRFLRICVSDTWSGGDFAHLMEITPYGVVKP